MSPSPAAAEPVKRVSKSSPSGIYDIGGAQGVITFLTVCPVTGETIGHNTPAENTNKNAVKKVEKKDEESKSKKVIQPPNVKETDMKAVETPNKEAPQATTAPTDPAPVPASVPAPTPVAASTPAPAPCMYTETAPAVQSSSPVKTRRVPPGGHTQALW